MDELVAMPATTVQADIYCYGTYVTGGNWTGVQLGQILDNAEVKPLALSIAFVAEDGYTVTIPLTYAMREEVIIAYQLNGQPLSEGLRLVLPGANGASWIAMITQMTLTTQASANPEPIGAVQPNFNNFPSDTITKTSPAPPTPDATSSATPAPTPAQSPTPTPENQTGTQAAVQAPTDSQPQSQESSSSPGFWEEYGLLFAFAAVVVVVVTAVSGYFIRRRGVKNTKTSD